MKVKKKKTLVLLFLAGCVLAGYWLWLSLRPVEIIGIHQRFDTTSVLVNNFPLTNKGKINWWLKNKDMLKTKYNIPKPDPDGDYAVIFWDFGDGYKETDGYDRLCFDDMPPPVNCIEKEKELTIKNSKRFGVRFLVSDGYYQLKENGDVVKFN
ncbi:DUF943 family protein [Erwinia sp. CPCC 100877]|nr:DUF943 family protein [Erwinia sp. CPCC 100877]